MEQSFKDKLEQSIPQLELYVVINSSGQFFRSKGFGGYGKSWVDDIKKARAYGKIGPARSQVTWFSNSYPDYPTPAILKLNIGSYEILNETERVEKAKKSIREKEMLRKTKQAKSDFEYAKKNLEIAQQNLEKARLKIDNN